MTADSSNRPPETVVEAFRADGAPEVLAGGVGGRAFRAGTVVLKPVSSLEEAEWASTVYERLEGPGFRVPRPLRSRDGHWVVDGWQASEFVKGAHAGRNGGRWQETLAACRAFHRALEGVPRPAFLNRRTDPWSEADRVTFREKRAEPLPAFAEAIGRLTAMSRPVEASDQVIHGDFTANVLFEDGEEPCVIDFSPYWRPAEFALGVVVSDAISWTRADPALVDLCADVPHFGQWLLRATLRRVWELDQHTRQGRGNMEAYLAEYLPMFDVFERTGMRGS